MTAKSGVGNFSNGGATVDEELLRALREGREHAGAFVVSHFAPRMLGYARTVAPRLGDADRELICEQAVELACRKIDNFDPARGTFEAWLRGFVRFGVLNWLRSAAVQEELSDDDPRFLVDATSNDPQPDNPAVKRLSEVLRRLAPEDQLLILLRYQEARPTKVVAEVLNVSDDAVRKRLSRLVRRLATELGG